MGLGTRGHRCRFSTSGGSDWKVVFHALQATENRKAALADPALGLAAAEADLDHVKLSMFVIEMDEFRTVAVERGFPVTNRQSEWESLQEFPGL